jgi:hypothetical protein
MVIGERATWVEPELYPGLVSEDWLASDMGYRRNSIGMKHRYRKKLSEQFRLRNDLPLDCNDRDVFIDFAFAQGSPCDQLWSALSAVRVLKCVDSLRA